MKLQRKYLIILLINCKFHNFEGLIFNIKNKNKDSELFLKDNSDYELNMIREIFKKIVPTFCQDIIASLLSITLEQEYKQMNDIVIDIYKKSKYNNFESFFENIESKKNIIYTFSKITENLLEEEKIVKNKYGLFNKDNISIYMIESIKSENDLLFLLKSFVNYKVKKLLVFRFSEKDLDKMNSVNYIINNFEKENPIFQDKLLIFLIHKKRIPKSDNSSTKEFSDLISFINDDYYQLFIDNLQGKENSDIFKIMQKK